METKLETQTKNFETQFANNPTIRIAVGLALRHWLAYAVADIPEPRESLYKASNIAASMLRANKSDMRLFCLTIFFAIELNQYDKANEMLDNALHYRSFYKNNAAQEYNTLTFLYAYLEIKQNRIKSAGKYIKILENEDDKNFTPDNLIMLGIIQSALGNSAEAYNYFMDFHALYPDTKNVFWFYGLFSFYKRISLAREKFKIREYDIFLRVIYWALNHGANVENIVNALPPSSSLAVDINLCERIYSQFPNPWLLKGLCEYYMAKSDYSPKAYNCYRDAERRQILLPNLSYFLVQSAFKNGSESIQRFTMLQYLAAPDGDIDLQVFVYHLLLTEPNMSDLAAARVKEILQLASYCLQNGIKGRYVNSLYYFLWINFNDAPHTDISEVRAILQEDICKFEIVNPNNNARYLYVNEWERQTIMEYEFPKDGSPLVIEALGSGFRYTVLGNHKIQILDTHLDIRRKVASAGVSLYLQFYENGLRTFEIIAYLAKSYLQTSQKDNPNWETILKLVLTNKNASNAFKTQCNVALGQLYYNLGKMDLALEFYSKADENAVEDELLDHMLNAYIQQKAYKAAAGLVSRKADKVKDKTLFTAIKMLAEPACQEWHNDIAQPAYSLLLRMRYNKNILSLVLQNFTGTQQQWLNLHSALTSISVQDENLENLILHNAVWLHHFDEQTQKIFARRVFDSVENFNNDILNFVYYSAYEVIIKNAKPIAETLSALEIVVLENESQAGKNAGKSAEENTEETTAKNSLKLAKSLAAFALCHVYLEHDIKTLKSEEIIKMAILLQKNSGIMFPVFKDGKNPKRLKDLRDKYLEKYRPLVYKTLPGKNVWLYYKVDGEDEWRSQPMKYWRFGLYIICIPHFYNENLIYYFSEELPTGSITTKHQEVHNKNMYLEESTKDAFFTINNATIYEQMFRYEQVEEIIGDLVKEVKFNRNRLIST
ncbi:MAG: DUF5717 family protein [Defluviitaleaceae bacterium]|nr:DUF5717 family protein [Defluviitaleaceae bacterium]